MKYSQEEKQQLVKYAKQAISLFSFGVEEIKQLQKGPRHILVAQTCFDLAEAMVEEQRKRFGK
jgi:hypothetical protein